MVFFEKENKKSRLESNPSGFVIFQNVLKIKS